MGNVRSLFRLKLSWWSYCRDLWNDDMKGVKDSDRNHTTNTN